MDSELPQAHFVLAYVNLFRRELTSAARSAERALELIEEHGSLAARGPGRPVDLFAGCGESGFGNAGEAAGPSGVNLFEISRDDTQVTLDCVPADRNQVHQELNPAVTRGGGMELLGRDDMGAGLGARKQQGCERDTQNAGTRRSVSTHGCFEFGGWPPGFLKTQKV